MTNPKPNPDQHQSGQSPLDLITRRLGLLARRARMILIAQSVLFTTSVVLASALGIGLIDALLHLPMGLRLILLAGLITLVYRLGVGLIRPAYRFRISPTDVALHIEQQDPSTRGVLAGAVDLHTRLEQSAELEHTQGPQTQGPSDQWIENALAQAAVANAARRLSAHRWASMLNLRQLFIALAIFGSIIAVVLGLRIQSPDHVRIGISRVLMPWTDTRWPIRFAILDQTNTSARAIDIAVPIRVLIGSPRTAAHQSTDAMVHWRVLDPQGNAIGKWNSSVLVPQQRRDEETRILIFEQLLDLSRELETGPKIAPATSSSTNQHFLLEYKLSTRDDSTSTRQIPLARPPELLETTIDITLPPYAQPLDGTDLVRSGETRSWAYDSLVSPILVGSSVTITWHLSKPIESFADQIPQWAASLNAANTIEELTEPTPSTIGLKLIMHESAIIEPKIIDELEIPIRTPIVLSLEALPDRRPGASIIRPTHDETVSTRALIDINGELTDDLGLSRGLLSARIARPPASASGSSGASHELIEPITDDPMQGLIVDQQLNAELRSVLSATLDLSTLDLRPDDQVWIQAVGWDLRRTDKNKDRGRGESPIRILRVVADTELIDRIRDRLTPISSTIRQLDEQQSKLVNQLRDGQLESSTEQRALGNGINANKEIFEQMRESMIRNRLQDPSLESVLANASSILQEASIASQHASDLIDRGQHPQANMQQEAVQNRLGELLTMLDRGQGSYLALRSIQQLRDKLESLRDDTAELNAQTAGRSLDELSQEEQSTLEQILNRQLASADDARDAMSTLDEQSKELQEHDPIQAQALEQAAQKGRRAQLEDRLRQAGEQIASNQTASASQTQSAVLEELEEMIEQLENATQNRDNALRRALASIIESIQGLIDAQQSVIDTLALPDLKSIAPSFESIVITLNKNTLAVRDDARGAFPQTRVIADRIDQAARAQGASIGALRESPPDIASALRADRTSLLNLNEALNEARRLDEQAAQREANRLRAQLRDAYNAALESQVSLRDETATLDTKLADDRRLTRRQRATARAIARAQSQVKADLADLITKTQELNEAPVFKLAHTQLDRMMSQTQDQLAQQTLSPRALQSQDASIAILSTLVAVLSDQSSKKEPDDFDDAQSGGASSGSGGGEEPVIPPIAQLVLLRSMQQLAADQTRMMNQRTLHDEPNNPDDLQALSDLQSQLFEHAMDLIKQMNNNPSPSNPSPKDTDSTDKPNRPIDPDGGLPAS